MHKLNALFAAELIFALIGTVMAGTAANDMSNAGAVASSKHRYGQALAHDRDAEINGRADFAAVSDALVGARQILTSSAGKTADETARLTLSTRVENASGALDRADSQLIAVSRAEVRSSKHGSATADINAAASRLKGLDLSAVTGLHHQPAEITADEVAVTEAGAARAAATARAAVAASHPAVATRDVWASGFQAQLDACRGAVELTGSYGVPTIGEKWGCGGSRFPAAGSLVQLTGLLSGTYRVGPVVAVLDAYTQSASDIPRGYQLLYQTCRGDDARTETFTALTRVS